MTGATLQTLIDDISREQSLKTWSLIMTFVGDAVVPRSGEIASSSLQAIMTQLGFDNGAVRTALSRLTSDGQLTRTRLGRNSYYSLAPSQLEQFAAAEKRIYASTTQQSGDKQCRLIVMEPGKPLNNTPDVSTPLMLSKELALVFNDASEQSPLKGQHCIMDGQCNTLPSDLLNNIVPESMISKHQTLVEHFEQLDASKLNTAKEITAYRCLLIHEWRRLKLKTPDIPLSLIDKDHPIRITHEFVAAKYDQIRDKSDVWLNEHAENSSGALGAPLQRYTKRFGLKP